MSVNMPLGLARSLAGMAADLASCGTEEALLAQILDSAFTLIPGTERSAVSLYHRQLGRVAATSDETAAACEEAQVGSEAGPGPDAVAQHLSIAARFPDDAGQWPALGATAARLGVRRVLCVPLSHGEQPLGTLTVYSGRADAFGPMTRDVAELVAAHAAIAVGRIVQARNLQAGMTTRQRIGEAVGILVERHRITPAQAFERLVLASQQRNIKVRELADVVVETGQEPADIRTV